MYRHAAIFALVAVLTTAGACGNPSLERVSNLVERAEGLLWRELVTRADSSVIRAEVLYNVSIPIPDVDAARRRIADRADRADRAASAQAAINDAAAEFDAATTRALALLIQP